MTNDIDTVPERNMAVRIAILEDHVRHVEKDLNDLKKDHDDLVSKSNKAAGGIIVLMGLGAILAWIVSASNEMMKWFK